MSRRAAFAGILATAALILGLSGVAVASSHIDTGILVHDGDTEVEPVVGGVITVCDFHLHAVIDGDDPDGHENGFWRITDTGAGGALVLDGQFDASETAPDRIPDSGTYSLPEGNYNLWWDHEPFVPGGSHREKDFAVVCPAGTPTPAPTGSVGPTASPGPTGSPAPTGSAAPTASSSTPGGSVLPTTGASPGGGAGVTLPPTDTAIAASRATTGDSSVAPIAIALGLLAGLAFLLTPRPVRVRTSVRHRR
jgi:hypothetical protein